MKTFYMYVHSNEIGSVNTYLSWDCVYYWNGEKSWGNYRANHAKVMVF